MVLVASFQLTCLNETGRILLHSSHGQRLFESCLPAIRKLLLKGLVCPDSCSNSYEQALQVLTMKVLQQQSWSSLAQHDRLAG